MVEVFQSGAANFQTFKTENALVNYGVINYGFSFQQGSEVDATEKHNGHYEPVATLASDNRIELVMDAIVAHPATDLCEVFRSTTDLRDFATAYSYASGHYDNGCNYGHLRAEYYRHFKNTLYTRSSFTARQTFLNTYTGRYAQDLKQLVNNFDAYNRA